MKRGIDHLVLCVSDLDRAAAFYERLGFTVTPRAEHPWGTDNRLVQLNGCFLELLTVGRPELIPAATERDFSFGAYNDDFLSRREGMSMLAFESHNAQADPEQPSPSYQASRISLVLPFTFPIWNTSRATCVPTMCLSSLTPSRSK